MSKRQYIVVGIDDNETPSLSSEIMLIIRENRVFSGGVRHRSIMEKYLPEGSCWIPITVPLSAVFEQYRQHERIVVFASGDPLFYGFATTILREEKEAEVKVFPSFNSLQQLAHGALLPYDDLTVVSLTGRPWKAFDKALIEGKTKIGILTDRKKTPEVIVSRMLVYGYDNYVAIVGECIGGEDERISTLSLAEVVKRQFTHPNNLILVQTAPRKHYFGIPDADFVPLNGRVKMITKAPIRLATLSLLDLANRHVFWDIGFCTGSVSIEARLQFPHLDIHGFEVREEGDSLMTINSRRMGAPGIDYTIGDFLTASLEAVPLPDAVFIGGHGGHLQEMVSRLASVMEAGSVLVFNSVSEQSKTDFINSINQAGFMLVRQLRMVVDENNPIDILKAIKQ